MTSRDTLNLLSIYVGLHYRSPTLASAISNLSLAFTFIVAIIFRMEILNLRSQSSILKLIGTIVSISGAFILIFYQGLPISNIFPSPTKPSLHSLVELDQTQPNWVLGGTFLSMSCVVLSLAYITKTWIARDYLSTVLIILVTFFFETIMVLFVTFIAENDASVWKPTFGIELTSILFGAISIGTLNIIDTWICKMKGPVFIAMFKPLQMIIAVLWEHFFLEMCYILGV
ncbi:WAT1-related protein At3g28050-like isoform X2 [Chenopodium quinoa]|uniref:WAT1-related protein At3g28050-like isoform X2 n=1 Tax=Chenopodium quinoa TaxID=63459 RepID=UPI000B77D0B6|nr:WAT1-related protein At3g28050-like isoform X2 [Chenopodium quinoa]